MPALRRILKKSKRLHDGKALILGVRAFPHTPVLGLEAIPQNTLRLYSSMVIAGNDQRPGPVGSASSFSVLAC